MLKVQGIQISKQEVKMFENPLSISLEKQGIHDIFDAFVIKTIKPLDNSKSLDNAWTNLTLAIKGCQKWLEAHKNYDKGIHSDPIEFDIFQSFETEIHCLEMLSYIYVYRMEFLRRQETIKECKQIRSVKFTAISKKRRKINKAKQPKQRSIHR